jgi:hypothetical protein
VKVDLVKNGFAKCPKCGADVNIVTIYVGGETPAGQGFCPDCGVKVYTTVFWEEGDESAMVQALRSRLKEPPK